MEAGKKTKITIEAVVQKPLKDVWKLWTTPDDVVHWNNASDDWHTPHAKNDLRVGGEFLFRMEAKDGSFGFDFGGVYDIVKQYESIVYTMDDGRKVENSFQSQSNNTKITVTFDAESENPVEMQRDGWQAILNNFKKYAESSP